MVVWKRHGTDPSPGDIDHMIAALTAAAQTRFGIEPFSVDRDMRTIPDHWHAHARDEQWWPLRFERYMSRYTGIGTERVERT